MWESAIAFVNAHFHQLVLRTGEHLLLTAGSTFGAVLLGVPLGIVASRLTSLRGFLLGAIGVLQTIPSLAMLALLLTLLGRIGTLPAMIALVLYALLPVVRNTLAGIDGIPPDIIEASRAIGMTQRQTLIMVQLPLALPVMVAGIRTAAVVGVGIATLSAFIGAGGLGQFINQGLALSDTRLILLGAIPAGLLALVVDGSIAASEWGLRPTRSAQRDSILTCLKPVAVALPLVVALAGLPAYWGDALWGAKGANQATIRIGSKNFTEQLILGEMMAQLIEARTDLSVDRRFNLGGTMICHGALVNGEIDLYPEYTGTALVTILERPMVSDSDKALKIVQKLYRKRFDLEWLPPFGFNNTYALTVRKQDARQNHWKTISDLAVDAPKLSAGFTSEFSARPDGYPGLAHAYGLAFGSVRDLEPAIMYSAVADGKVDVICAFTTDGRIDAYDLLPLKDDKGFFPPYDAAPVARQEILDAHPEIIEALRPLAGALTQSAMRKLNYLADVEKRSPAEVAREYLESHGLIEASG